MRLQYLRLAMVVGVMVFHPPVLVLAATPEQIFVQTSRSVVIVEVFDVTGNSVVQGSGTVIGVGEVITNCHVAQKGTSLKMRQLGKSFDGILRYADPERDLCQLSVPELHAPPALLGTARNLKVGQRVYAIGAPQGLELTLSEGLVSSLRRYEGAQYIQTSAAISPGSSGGGLFDEEGRLIGITTFQFIEGQNLNFALPVDWIAEVSKRAKEAPLFAQQTVLDWLNRAIALDERGDWDALLELSKEWLKKEPKNFNAWYSLGRAYMYLSHSDKAIDAVQEALRIDPENANVWLFLALTYEDLKQYDQAVRAYREVLRIQPEDANFWGILAFVYHDKLKQYDRAIEAYQELLRFRPKDNGAWMSLGLAHSELKQWDQAILAYREALHLQPKDVDTWFFLGRACSNLGQYDEAVHAFREALRIQPENVSAWYHLGATYFKQGRRERVREVYLDPAYARSENGRQILRRVYFALIPSCGLCGR